MFTCFFDAESCKPMDPDGLHPFCLASKLNADDCPSFKEILHVDKETCDAWFDAMEKELQDLFKSGTFKFVSQDKVLKPDKEIFLIIQAFWKKRHPSVEVYQFKARICVRGDLQRKKFSNNKTSAPVVEWQQSECSFHCQLLKGGLQQVSISRMLLLRLPYLSLSI